MPWRRHPAAIAEFLSWLRKHREPLVPEAHVSRPSVADLFVAEIKRGGAPSAAGSKAALFEFDKADWSDERLERTLRWLSYSRADLLARIEGMSEADLESRQIAPSRTLRQTLWHVANAEYGYANSVAGPLDKSEAITDTEPSDVRERLIAVRDILERRIRAIPGDKRGEVVYAAWTDRPDEPWTVPKALRRALEHEREHLAEL